MDTKASDYPPGAIRVFMNGTLIDGLTKVAVGKSNDDRLWVSITTDPDDESYRDPLGEFAAADDGGTDDGP